MSEDKEVGLGAKTEMIFVNVERQLARVESVLSAFKNITSVKSHDLYANERLGTHACDGTSADWSE